MLLQKEAGTFIAWARGVEPGQKAAWGLTEGPGPGDQAISTSIPSPHVGFLLALVFGISYFLFRAELEYLRNTAGYPYRCAEVSSSRER